MTTTPDVGPTCAVAQPRSKPRGAISTLILLVLLAASIFAAYQNRAAAFDDSFIYARVVHNVLDNHHWSFNPDRAINPCTSPLYFALLLTMSFCLQSIPAAMAVLHAVLLSGTVLLLFRYLQSSTHWVVATLACLGFLHNPFVHNLNGVETLLMLAFTLASLLAYRRKRYVLTAFLLSLLVLSRGDGLLLAGLVFVHYTVSRRRFCGLAVMAAFAALPVAWSVLHYSHFATLLPGTLAVKTAQGQSGDWNPFSQGLSVLFWDGKAPLERTAVLCMLVLAVVGWFISIARRDAAGFLLGLFSLLHFGTYCLLGVAYYHWYYGVEYLATWVLATEALALGFRIPRRNLGLRLLRLAGATAGTLGYAVILYALADFRGSYRYTSGGPPAQYGEVADQIRPRLPSGSRLLAAEVGSLGWHLPDMIVEDSVGLSGLVAPGEIRSRQYNAWLSRSDRLPDYVLILDRFTGLTLNGDLRRGTLFEQNYRRLMRVKPTSPAFQGNLYRRVTSTHNTALASECDLLLQIDPAHIQHPAVMFLQLMINEQVQPALFEHPTRSIPVAVTPTQRYLRFGFGMIPDVYSLSDGARFIISVAQQGGDSLTMFDRAVQLDTNPDDRRWHEAVVDLQQFTGKQITITFSTEPLATPTHDQAVWVRPRLTNEPPA